MPENVEMKVGVDGGGGFLKITLNIIDLEECAETPQKRAKYSDGIEKSKLKSTGVKKLIILSLAPDISETHENMYVLWNLLQIQNALQKHIMRFATDLKMANILLGLMSHSSSHPCSWCDVERSV